jgi:RNA polymerase sigma-70 factor, ECF subfamily
MADDRDRFERIYHEHFRAVLRFAVGRIDPERAKDVAAETFLVAWRRLDEVPEEPRPWLFGVARRVIAGQFRSAARRDALAVRLEAEPSGGADPDLAGMLGDRGEVLAAFTALRERDREVLRLVTWDGLDAAEAAQVLSVTKLAFAVRLHRARRRFREELERADGQAEIPSLNPRRHADAHR